MTRRQRLATVFEVFHERGCALLEQLWEGLSGIPGVRLFGPPPSAPRTPTLSLDRREDSRPPRSPSGWLGEGSSPLTATSTPRPWPSGSARLDDGLVRIGCACYTTENEVDRVIESLRAIARGHD